MAQGHVLVEVGEQRIQGGAGGGADDRHSLGRHLVGDHHAEAFRHLLDQARHPLARLGGGHQPGTLAGALAGGDVRQFPGKLAHGLGGEAARHVIAGFRSVILVGGPAHGEHLQAGRLGVHVVEVEALGPGHIRHRAHHQGGGDRQLGEQGGQAEGATHRPGSRRVELVAPGRGGGVGAVFHAPQSRVHRFAQRRFHGLVDAF